MVNIDQREYANLIFENSVELREVMETELLKKKNLKILHVNIRSLRTNWSELQWEISTLGIQWEIIVLTEINIKKNEVDLYNIKGYTNYAITREHTSRGGGIMIFVLDKIPFKTKPFKLEVNDGVEVEVKIKDTDFCILAIYRQPSTDKQIFIKELKTLLKDTTKSSKKNIILIRDINIDILPSSNDKYEQLKIDKYENMLAAQGFEVLINSPTREEIRDKEQNHLVRSCIDHIYAKVDLWSAKGAILTKKVSDHYITACWVCDNNSQEDLELSKKELWEELNHHKIINEMNLIDWSVLDTIKCPNAMMALIQNKLQNIYDRSKIVKQKSSMKRSIENGRNRWITHEIITLINKKKQMWKKIKKGKSIDQEQIKQYNKLRNLVSKKIKNCKQTFFKAEIDKVNGNNKMIGQRSMKF